MSDTPRTDFAETIIGAGGYFGGGGARGIKTEFCRQLERELAAAKAEIERLTRVIELHKEIESDLLQDVTEPSP